MNQFILIIKVIAFVIIVIDSNEIKCGGGKYRETKIKIDHLKRYLELYKKDLGYYPKALQSLLFEENTKWKGPYISSRNLTDAWKNQYKYELVANNQYKIVSYGQDGKDGGEGQRKDIVFFKSEMSLN